MRDRPVFQPPVSVVVRSYKRPAALLELLDALRTQRYPSFEVMICDQSDDPALVRRVEALADPRIRLLLRSPLGASGSRNECIRHARGEILVMIDDDDLPVDDQWINHHVENYRDPRCQGVVGRCVDTREQAVNVRISARARRQVMKLSFWRDGTAYAWLGERKEGIDYLLGTNASVRRTLVDRIGGWDEVPHLLWGEEQSFSLKFQKERLPGEHLVFDPKPVAVRRTAIEGGLSRRTGRGWARRELTSRVMYFHKVAAHYHPWRFWLLYPLFQMRTLAFFTAWIWDKDNRHLGVGERVGACLHEMLMFPWLVLRYGLMPTTPEIRRVGSLTRPDDEGLRVTEGETQLGKEARL